MKKFVIGFILLSLIFGASIYPRPASAAFCFDRGEVAQETGPRVRVDLADCPPVPNMPIDPEICKYYTTRIYPITILDRKCVLIISRLFFPIVI